jgi:hypothetical protein
MGGVPLSAGSGFQLFLSELCDVLGVARPGPTRADDRDNAYVFERAVRFDGGDGIHSTGRIDLYRRGCFVLEAKQGSAAADGEADQPLLPALAAAARAGAGKGKKGTAVRGTRGWDAAMERARAQAERDVRARPPSDGNPPFVIVVDVGHTIELYAEFTRLGKNVSLRCVSRPGSARAKETCDSQRQLRYAFCLALPDDEHLPTHSAQASQISAIAGHVSRELGSPILSTHGSALMPLARVSVPEAPANLDNLSMSRKHEVRAAGQVSLV